LLSLVDEGDVDMDVSRLWISMDDEEIIYLCWGGVETGKIHLVANYECLPLQIQKYTYRFVINRYSYEQGWFLSLLYLSISFV
jgi:hypothetical protein